MCFSHFPIIWSIYWRALGLSFQHFRCLLSLLRKHWSALLFTGQEWEADTGFHSPPGPAPTSPARHPIPSTSLQTRLFWGNLSNLTVNDKNHEVYPAASGENLECSRLLFILSPHIQIHFCFFSQVFAHRHNFLLDFNAQWKEVSELDRGWVRII